MTSDDEAGAIPALGQTLTRRLIGMTSFTDRFVVNVSHQGVRIVHNSDCRSIAHQVNREASSDGYRQYEAAYVTRHELATLRRFRPCGMCAPDVLPKAPGNTRTVKASNLTARHIGLAFEEPPIGRLTSARTTTELSALGTSTRVHLTGEAGASEVGPDDHLLYLRAH